MRGGSEKGIGRETSSKAKKNVVRSERERAEEGGGGRPKNEERRVRCRGEDEEDSGQRRGKVRGQGRKTG